MTGRRDRPTEMIGDRQRPPGAAGYPEGPYGPGPTRGAVPNVPNNGGELANGAERTTASGPVRAVRPVSGRAAADGVGTAAGGADHRRRRHRDGASRPNGRPGPARNAPPARRPVRGRRAAVDRRPGRSLGPAARGAVVRPGPWESYRSTPAGGPNRARPAPGAAPATAAPGREQPAALREPVGRPYLPAAVPPPAPHRPAAVPRRGAARGRAAGVRCPTPGRTPGRTTRSSSTTSDEDGPETVVGAATPRRAARAFPSLLDGPATDLDLGGRRRTDGPVTRVDAAGRPARRRTPRPGSTSRGSGAVPGRRTSARPAGRAGSDGPATDFDVTAFDVPVRPGPRVPAEPRGRSAACARPARVRHRPATGRSCSCARRGAGPRVRPFARKVVDEPTELTDRSLDELDGFDDVHDADGFGGFGG